MSTAPTALGSDVWLGAGEYDDGDVLHTRATDFFAAVNWDALLSVASKQRDGTSCSLAKAFSIGHFNMARRLDFEDGTAWVARLRMPTYEDAAERETLSARRTMEIEIASMKFFGSKTSITVPAVHAFDLCTENEVGAPYILMDYIHGTAASELRKINDCAPGLFGTLEQDQKFREQVAQIQATIASFRFPQIGSLYFDEKASDFYIGPELQTGKGPWTSATDYYDDLTKHLLQADSKQQDPENKSIMLPPALNFLQRIYGEEREGPFRLTNRDFGAHNILVNEDHDILGVIDFDGVMSAPIEAVAQHPLYCFLQVEPPGVVDTRPAAVERVAKTIPRLQKYKSILAKCEEGDQSKISDHLGSTSASIYQGIMTYQQHQESTNERWMKSCMKMLQSWVQRKE